MFSIFWLFKTIVLKVQDCRPLFYFPDTARSVLDPLIMKQEETEEAVVDNKL